MRAEFVRDAEAALGAEGIVKEPEQLRTYECDGLTGYRVVPGLVALPRSTEEVQALVRLCARDDLLRVSVDAVARVARLHRERLDHHRHAQRVALGAQA